MIQKLEQPPLAWRKTALRLALETAPKTSWQCEPAYTHNHDWLSLETITLQYENQAHRVREAVLKAPLLWATTGRWPSVRNAASFFLRVALEQALRKSCEVRMLDNKEVVFSAPPWSMDEAVWLTVNTVMVWYMDYLPRWIEDRAQTDFAEQPPDQNNY